MKICLFLAGMVMTFEGSFFVGFLLMLSALFDNND